MNTTLDVSSWLQLVIALKYVFMLRAGDTYVAPFAEGIVVKFIPSVDDCQMTVAVFIGFSHVSVTGVLPQLESVLALITGLIDPGCTYTLTVSIFEQPVTVSVAVTM